MTTELVEAVREQLKKHCALPEDRRAFAEAIAVDARIELAALVAKVPLEDAKKWIKELPVRAYIEHVKRENQRALMQTRPRNTDVISVADVLALLSEIAALGSLPLFDFSTDPPQVRITEENAHMIKKIRWDKDGSLVGIEVHDRMQALRLLGQHHGLFQDNEDSKDKRRAIERFQEFVRELNISPEALRAFQLRQLSASNAGLPPLEQTEIEINKP